MTAWRDGPSAGWRPQTLKEVMAPVRAYLFWALQDNGPFEGATVFAGEIAGTGRSLVRIRVELVAVRRDEALPG